MLLLFLRIYKERRPMSLRTNPAEMTFTVPYIEHTLHLPISHELRSHMSAVTHAVARSHEDDYGQMRATIQKVVPIALGVLAATILCPLWVPVATISSLFLGPISWILAGVTGCYVWGAAQKVMEAFNEQCPELVHYAAARGVMYQRNITLESLDIRS